MGQRDFVNRLLAAQTEVQDTKEALAIRVAGAKSAFLNRTTPFDLQQSSESHQADIGPSTFEGAGTIDPFDIQQSAEARSELIPGFNEA